MTILALLLALLASVVVPGGFYLASLTPAGGSPGDAASPPSPHTETWPF